MKKLITILGLLSIVTLNAQYPPVNIPGTEVRTIISSVVKGQEYELHILLPGGYARSNKKYPVVYLMDSQWDFPLVKSLYGQHYYDGFIPELIIVGITWGGVKPNPDSLRARDYTPTREDRLLQSGGADKFLQFMREELFPFMSASYKVDTSNRTLMGCSLGGLLTLYALFTQPEMFTGYAAASPAVGWDKEVLYKYEKAFAEKKLEKPARVYMTIGDVERSRPAYERFAGQMKSRSYVSVNLVSKILENTGHSGTKSETYGRGLQYIFERPKLDLDVAVLNKYTGTYQSANGNEVEIKNEDGQLVLYFPGNNKYALFAAGETEFYSTAEFLIVRFTTENNKIQGLKLERYGSVQLLIKEN